MSFDWDSFDQNSWVVFDQDKAMVDWANEARKSVKKNLSSKVIDKKQLRCGDTWFVGVNFLENNWSGTIGNVAFNGGAVKAILQRYKELFDEWDKAQVSICFQGYPKKNESETEASFNYRKTHFGAHVDGILPVGKPKRRYAKEHHSFIFGVPLVHYNDSAAPIVVWEGSHHIIRNFLVKKLSSTPSNLWEHEDITKIYNEARREVFLKCKQKQIVVPVGGSYLLHRLALHGVLPWGEKGDSDKEGRMIAYFRPLLNQSRFWLNKSV